MSEPTEIGSGDAMPERFFASGRRWLLACLLLGGLLFAGLAAVRGYQRAWHAWGIQSADTPFLDLQVVTAGAESRALGFDPLHENPCDPLRRQLNYPRLWQSLAQLGVARRHTTALGIGVVVAFLAAVLVFARRLERGAALGIAALLLSPVAMLALERGNIDLVLFVVATLALLAARRSGAGATALLLVGFALKLYPVFGFPLLWRESRRRFLLLLGGIALVVAAYILWRHEELRAIRAATPSDAWLSYGVTATRRTVAANLVGASRGIQTTARLLALAAGAAFGCVLVRRLCVGGSDTLRAGTPPPELDAFRLGAGIHTGTFLLGSNFDYRLVFLLFAVPQLWRWARGEHRELRIAARVTGLALLLAAWHLVWRPALARAVGENGAALLEQAAKCGVFGGCAYLLVASAPRWLRESCVQAGASIARVWRCELGRPRFLLPALASAAGLVLLVLLHWRGFAETTERIVLPGSRSGALLAQALWCDDVSVLRAQAGWPQPCAQVVGRIARLAGVPAVHALRAAQALATILALAVAWLLGRELVQTRWRRLVLFSVVVWAGVGLQSQPLAQWCIPMAAGGLIGWWLLRRSRTARGRARWAVLAGAAAFGAVAAIEFVGGLRGVPARGPREGRGLERALVDLTPPGATWLIAGDNALQLLPVAAGRRSRLWGEESARDVPGALAALERDYIGALVLGREAKLDDAQLAELCARLNLDDQPTFSHALGRVHLSRFFRDAAVTRFATAPFAGVTTKAEYEGAEPLAWPRRVPAAAAASVFPMIEPRPVLYDLAFGYALWTVDGIRVVRAHADSSLWLPASPAATHIRWEFGIIESAYCGDPATNGVEFIVEAETADGACRTIFRRLLDPVQHEGDRGLQREDIPFALRPGERRLVFRSAGNGDNTCDSAYWQRIRVN